MTTATPSRPRRARFERRAYRTRTLPATPELLATLPLSWQPVHRAVRDTTPAWCTRCDRYARLPFGPGEDLCQPCRDGEQADRAARR